MTEVGEPKKNDVAHLVVFEKPVIRHLLGLDAGLFPGAMEPEKRLELLQLELSRYDANLTTPWSENTVRQIASRFDGDRGMLVRFVKGDVYFRLTLPADVPGNTINAAFEFLVKLAMEMSKVECLPAKRIAILACDFARRESIDAAAVESLMTTIADQYAAGAKRPQHRLFEQMTTRLKDDGLLDDKRDFVIEDGSEAYEGERFYDADDPSVLGY